MAVLVAVSPPAPPRLFITGNVLPVTELRAGKPSDITPLVEKHCRGSAIVDGKDKSDYVVLLTFVWGAAVGKTTSYRLFTREGEYLGGDSPVSLEEAFVQACGMIRKHLAGELHLDSPGFPAEASLPRRPEFPTAVSAPPRARVLPAASPQPSPSPGGHP